MPELTDCTAPRACRAHCLLCSTSRLPFLSGRCASKGVPRSPPCTLASSRATSVVAATTLTSLTSLGLTPPATFIVPATPTRPAAATPSTTSTSSPKTVSGRHSVAHELVDPVVHTDWSKFQGIFFLTRWVDESPATFWRRPFCTKQKSSTRKPLLPTSEIYPCRFTC